MKNQIPSRVSNFFYEWVVSTFFRFRNYKWKIRHELIIFRVSSRVDLSASVACSSSDVIGSSTSLTAIGRSAPIAGSGNAWRYKAGSAPCTPRTTPPASPQHYPRRTMPLRPNSHQTSISQLATCNHPVETSQPMT